MHVLCDCEHIAGFCAYVLFTAYMCMTADCDPQQKQAMQRLFHQIFTGAFGCLKGIVHALMLSAAEKTCSAGLICLAIQVWIDHDRQKRIAHAVLGKRCIELL